MKADVSVTKVTTPKNEVLKREEKTVHYVVIKIEGKEPILVRCGEENYEKLGGK